MKKLIIFISLFTLTACFEDKKSQQEEHCFDIMDTSNLPNKILINKCTGDTWTMQFEEYPNTKKKGQTVGSRSFKWTKINKTDDENIFNGF